MTASALRKFLVLYLVPADVMADWAKTDPAARKSAEEQMRGAWQRWMADNAKIIRITEAAGATKAVTVAGVADIKNEIMLYSIVETDSHESASRAFAHHPHLTIPKASIQITELRSMGPM